MFAGLPAGLGAEDADTLGPLFHRFPLTLAEGERTEAFGPLLYRERAGERETLAVPPFFSRVTYRDVDAAEFDVLYPLLSYDRFGAEYRFHIFQVFNFSGGQTQEEKSVRRFSLFPLYFQQRAADTNLNYTALVPLYGTLKGRLFRDEIHFVLFPLWSETRKKDVVTENYLYPFFHVRHGERLHGWQFWPVTGREHRDTFVRTNYLGLEETVGGHDKFFALWPFYYNERTGLGTTNEVHEHALWPFVSAYRSPARDSTTYLWPFIEVTHDREKKYDEIGAPWPLVVFAHGEGKTIRRVFPFYSHAASESQTSDFVLWPVWKHNTVHSDPLERDRRRVLFFLYSDLSERNLATSNTLRRVDFWPLFTWKHELDGNERLQVLAPVEPVLPSLKSIERNWSPLWSLWRDERNAKTGAHSQSLLWNLYRRDETPAAKKCSLLFGAVQYESGADGARWRWLWLPPKKAQP